MKRRRVISGWGDTTATDSSVEPVELAHPIAWPFLLLIGYGVVRLFLSPDRPRKDK